MPLAKRDMEELLYMAIDNVPPFEESNEKGFRDSLIMFSILEAMKARPEMNALVVSSDKLFTQGIVAKQEEYGTSITVVEDLGKAVAHILTLVDDALRERRRREKQEAKELLLKYRSELEKSVANIKEFSYFEFIGSKVGSVESIVSLTLKDVASATWKERTENSATVLFSLDCELTVLARPSALDFLNTRLQVGGGVVLTTPTSTKLEQKTVDKMIFGVAEFAKKDGQLQLVRLETDKRLPDDEFIGLLVRE